MLAQDAPEVRAIEPREPRGFAHVAVRTLEEAERICAIEVADDPSLRLGVGNVEERPREHLLAQVWGASYRGGRRTVDVHIRRLRAKLGAALRIETVRSGGYKLCPEVAG